MTIDDDTTSALCERLRVIPVAVVSDTLAAMGLPDQVLSFALRPVESGTPFAGPAVCFSGAGGAHRSPPGTPALVYEADRRIVPRCVAVVGTGAHRTGAVIGGNTVTSWRRRGCAAVVTDGLIRDSVDFADLPTYAAGVTPLNNRGRWSYRSLDSAVTMPGQSAKYVVVHPGDIVHGDRDGLIVVPRRVLNQLVRDAEVVAGVEQRMRAQIESGTDREQVYNDNDRFSHVQDHTRSWPGSEESG
jgi:regulator of RNase E activity RraA